MVTMWPPVMWLSSAPMAVVEGGCAVAALRLRRAEPAGKQPHGCRLDIALAARDLSGEAQLRPGLQGEGRIEQARRVEVGVAVEPSQARELRVLQARVVRNRRTCSACFSFVWKPTML